MRTNYTIKSAYDSNTRRAEESQMYGYESIAAGTQMCFELSYTDNVSEASINSIEKALLGKKRLGRSSSAQFGWIEITEGTYHRAIPRHPEHTDLYLESRLVVINPATGYPTLQPTAQMLGIMDSTAQIIWSESSIRTFRYSPYNAKRNCYDAEHIGFEKGSVIKLKLGNTNSLPPRLGNYHNQGFGCYLLSPSFLYIEDGTKIKESDHSSLLHVENSTCQIVPSKEDNDLIKWLSSRKNDANADYELVNKTIEDPGFQKKDFCSIPSSQWGSIRNIVTDIAFDGSISEDKRKDAALGRLFAKHNEHKHDQGFLVHGKSESIWKKYDRVGYLEKLFSNSKWTLSAIINLSSIMSKKSSSK